MHERYRTDPVGARRHDLKVKRAEIEALKSRLERAEHEWRSMRSWLREACTHPRAVEIRYEWEEPLGGDNAKRRAAGRRYCLACGLDEPATTYVLHGGRGHYRYRDLEKSEVVRQETCRESAEYTGLLEMFGQRLHEQARFDEFDGQGVWLGEKTPSSFEHLVRGED